MATAHLVVRGRVQGVFYRHSTRERAKELGLSGWVRNLLDGTVEVEVSGKREAVDKLIQWCKSGPPSARVEAVDVNWIDEADGTLGQSDFAIR